MSFKLEQFSPKIQADILRQISNDNTAIAPVAPIMPGKRIRQDSKPLMNGLETEFFALLKSKYPAAKIRAQQFRVRLSNGAWFKVDFALFDDGKLKCFEVKGPKEGKNVARGLLALKCAAGTFDEIEWSLVWKEGQSWKIQQILP